MLIHTSLLILSSIIVQDQSAPKWTKVSLPEKGFAIEFPGKHAEATMMQKDRDGRDVMLTIYRANVGQSSFLASLSEYSSEYLKNSPETIFNNARDGSIERSKGKLISERNVELGKNKGREFTVEVGQNAGFVRARVFLVNKIQYSVMMTGKTLQSVQSPTAERFFKSFEFVKDK